MTSSVQTVARRGDILVAHWEGRVSGAPCSFAALSFWRPARETRHFVHTPAPLRATTRVAPTRFRDATSVFSIHRDGLDSADSGTAYPDCLQHFCMNSPPILVEVDRPSLNAETLKLDVRLLADRRPPADIAGCRRALHRLAWSLAGSADTRGAGRGCRSAASHCSEPCLRAQCVRVVFCVQNDASVGRFENHICGHYGNPCPVIVCHPVLVRHLTLRPPELTRNTCCSR